LSNNSCYRVARPEVSTCLKSIWRDLSNGISFVGIG